MFQWMKKMMRRKKKNKSYLSSVKKNNLRPLSDNDKEILEERYKMFKEHTNKYGIAIVDYDFENEEDNKK